MFAQADWSPDQSPEATSRVNGFINRAYNQLALEAPFLFFETEAKITTEPDVESKDGDPTGAVGTAAYDGIKLLGNNTLPHSDTDAWTWTITYTTVIGAANQTLFNQWKYDRSWDGRMIEIISRTDGTVFRNQIRTIWLNTSTNRYEFTLVHPWDVDANGLGNDDNGGFKYRIYTEDYPLPDDVIQVKAIQLFDTSAHYPLTIIGQQEAEQRSLNQPRSKLASGIPSRVFRRQHRRLPGPSVAPAWLDENTVESDQGRTIVADKKWLGPEPPGTFEYVITYTWGKRDVEFRLPGLALWRGDADVWKNTDQAFETKPSTAGSSTPARFSPALNRYREPRFESAPSPVSVKATCHPASVKDQHGEEDPKPEDGYAAITIRLPDIEHALGFGGSYTSGASTYTRLSQNQSGIHVRIYRRRVSTAFQSYEEAMLYKANGFDDDAVLENSSAFYLLAETRVDTTNKGVFIDDGQVIPDHSRRLRDTHGYQTFGVYPKPDKRYEVDVRCVQRPPELEDDDDAPLIHAEAMNVLINRAMVLMYESMGNPAMSQYAETRYEQQLQTLSKRYGDLRPPGVPVLRRLSRARFGTRGNDTYHMWYSTDST